MKCEKCQGIGCFGPLERGHLMKCPDCNGTGGDELALKMGLGESLEIVQIPVGTEDAGESGKSNP